MRTEISVDIDRPLEPVFEHTTGDVTQWSEVCIRDEPIEERPGVVGSTFRLVTSENGREMEFTGEVVEHEPPKRSRVVLVGPAFDLDVLYTFEPVGAGTRVTQTSEVTGRGFFKLLLPLMGWMMRRSACKSQAHELDGLKRFCEAQPTSSSANPGPGRA